MPMCCRRQTRIAVWAPIVLHSGFALDGVDLCGEVTVDRRVASTAAPTWEKAAAPHILEGALAVAVAAAAYSIASAARARG